MGKLLCQDAVPNAQPWFSLPLFQSLVLTT